ncbi:winged helix-turn-helix domain-containing protein [Pseudoalteromonas sp. OOF1S-7]|uniref:winged helix-turn-helix domain-containing protein n=1 Tax=Pseudoalteromonas sp. OOF1S-7 TaxID=2917757 RepID=UPI001EF64DDE|nr:winged helix-turn-helix domain-containing protein [Pseudoalteromonas sp. OOF1S-7]MCG7534285.1 winged helix-turn-helix domain-containing protein [Pseudoalteromonas sp. OOF1S-7]
MDFIQIGEFRLYQQTNELITDEHSITLDPRLLSLLIFFIDNPNRIIGRDELQNAIWQGTIVTDNAINKLVANLRKVFCDDPKSPQYIQTVPKQGYRFIAPIKLGAEENTSTPARSAAQKRLSGRYLLAGLIILAGLLVSVVSHYGSSAAPQYGESRALSRVSGGKMFPVVLTQQAHVAFLNVTAAQGRSLWVAQYAHDSSALPQPIETPGYHLQQLLGSQGEYLVFKGYYKEQCGWFKARLDLPARQLAPPDQALYDCELIYHDSIYVAGDDLIYALAHERRFEHKNDLYALSFSAQRAKVPTSLESTWRLAYLDAHPGTHHLLLTAHTNDGNSRVLSYDPESAKQVLQLARTGLMHGAIWDHDHKGVVFSSSSPRTQMYHQAFTDNEATLLSSLSDKICCNIARHSNGADYVFTTYDKDIELQWLETGFVLDNSNGLDRSPRLAHTDNGVYFISDRSGSSQVYYQRPQEQASPLPRLPDHVRLRGMALSPDDELLLINHDNHAMWLIPTGETSQGNTLFFDGYIYQQSWLSNSLFALSVKQNERKRVQIYNRQMQQVAQLPEGWITAMADPATPEYVYLTDKNHTLYRFPFASILNGIAQAQGEQIGELEPFSSLELENGMVYLMTKEWHELVRYKVTDEGLHPLSRQDIGAYMGFDVRDGQVIYGRKAAFRSDVYSTVAR